MLAHIYSSSGPHSAMKSLIKSSKFNESTLGSCHTGVGNPSQEGPVWVQVLGIFFLSVIIKDSSHDFALL